MAAFLLLSVTGCVSPSENDRQLNHQIIGAAREIKAEGTPSIAAKASDIEANALTLQKNLIGAPKSPLPYSADTSREAREGSDKDHSGSWFGFLLTAVSTLVGGGIGARVIQQFFPSLFAGPAYKALTAVVGGVNSIKAKSEAGAVKWDDVVGELTKLQKDAGVEDLIHKLADKLKAT